MIKISNVQKMKLEKVCRLSATLEIDDVSLAKWLSFSNDSRKHGDFTYISDSYVAQIQASEKKLWFEVPIEYQSYVCEDRADAFVVAMCFYAMAVDSDIICEAPISDDLLFNLNYMLFPLMANIQKKNKIQIKANGITTVFKNANYVGTGMSCGVDSLQTLHEFSAEDMQEGFKLTHLTYFNVGADRWYLKPNQSEVELSESINKLDDIRNEKIEIAKHIADIKSLGFLVVDSNVSDIYQGCFEESHIYRSCAAILLLQKGFSKYYLSSTGCPYDDYQPKLRIDPGHYEQILLPCLSTRNLRFINSGKPYTRLQKIEQLQDDVIAQKYINVCSEKIPCYKCRKDFRTIISMELLECGEKFPDFFDEKRVKEVRWHAYLWLLRDRKEVVARDLWEAVKKAKIVPMKSYIAYVIWLVLHFLHLK